MERQENSKILVERARAGDRVAFEALVDRFRARLETLIRKRLGAGLRGRTTPADILQETLLQALQSLDRFSWRGEDSFLHWLAGIAENVIRKESRRLDQSRKIQLPAPGVEEASPSRQLRRHERFDRLERALAQLSEAHREVIVLSRIEGLRIREIARRMGRSESAIKNLLLRALGELQRIFGDTESLGLPPRRLGQDEEE